jgi:GNAT superfamily N-acetyltransferase
MSNTLFAGEGFRVRPLTATDAASVQAFLMACDDYAVMLTGKPHEADAAAQVFAALPPDKTAADKFVLAIDAPDRPLIGLIDAIRDYPEPGVWFLGLMLLRPDERSQGTGEKVYAAFAEWVFGQDGDIVRLGVVKQNERALAFWTKAGFQEVARQPMRFADKDTEAVILQDVLVADPEQA